MSAVPRDAGLVYVYLRPVSPQAGLPRVALAGCSLEREDGNEVPLLPTAVGADTGGSRGERLIARGRVGAGRFRGVVLRLSGGNGEEDTVRAPLSFDVAAGEGTVLALSLEGRAEELLLSAEREDDPTFGALGLVSSAEDDAVVLLDKRSGRVGGIVPTGRGPAGLVVDPESRRAYVVTTADAGVETIDLDRGAVSERRALRAGDEPVDLDLLPDRRTLLVVNRGTSTLSFLETEGLSEVDRIPVGSAPVAVAIQRGGRRAWVCNSEGSSISVVDVAARRVVALVPVDSGPVRGQFDRAEDRLWVLHAASPYLTGIDTRSLEVVERLNLGGGATAMRVDPRTDRIYLARSDGSAIDVYDPFSLLPVDTLPLAGRVAYLAFDAETNLLAAVLPEEGSVRAFSLVSRKPGWAAEVGGPVYLGFVGER